MSQSAPPDLDFCCFVSVWVALASAARFKKNKNLGRRWPRACSPRRPVACSFEFQQQRSTGWCNSALNWSIVDAGRTELFKCGLVSLLIDHPARLRVKAPFSAVAADQLAPLIL